MSKLKLVVLYSMRKSIVSSDYSVMYTEEQMVQIVQKAIKTLLSNGSSGNGINLPTEGNQSGTKKPDAPNNNYLCSKEAAKFLGISSSALKDWKKKKMIPYSQNTYKGRIFYDKSDLIAFVERNKKRKYC
jgi:hypothetical protein